ncbi:MAG: hypothetical protein AB7P03_12080 [Kofleriaceae bacterium]
MPIQSRAAHLPLEEHALRPDQCAQCGGTQLDVVDEVVEEKLHRQGRTSGGAL